MAIVDMTHLKMHASALIDQKARAEKELIDVRVSLHEDEARQELDFCRALEWDCDPAWLKTLFIVGRLERLSKISRQVSALDAELKKTLASLTHFGSEV